MKTTTSKIYQTCIIAFIIVGSLSAQNVITVDNTPNSTSDYTTLQAGIDAAVAGDFIYLQPSPTTYGTGTIDKSLTIVGRSHSEAGNITTIGTVQIKTNEVLIKGVSGSLLYIGYLADANNIEVYESKFSTVYAGFSSATVDNLKLRGNIFTTVTQSPNANNVLVSNNIITSGISVSNPTGIVVTNNIFRFTSSFSLSNSGVALAPAFSNNMFICNSSNDRNVNFSGNGDWNISYNLSYNYGTGNVIFQKTSGTGTFQENNSLLNTNPEFINVDSGVSGSLAGTSTYYPANRLEDDLTLPESSPAFDGGSGGEQIGIFNNGFNFKYLGNPRGIPTMDILTYDGTVPKNGNINVTIKAKAH
jgi:hypothetical protein